MKDLFGQAILDYQQGQYTEDLKTETSISEEDVLPLPYLFRDYAQMPPLEQQALQMACGRVLDVGCGAGSHALYLQNERGLEVTAIDLSAKAIEVCQLRGIRSARVQNVLDTSEKYDTLLLLMNGAGMCGRLKKMPAFFAHLKTLLNEGGQILTDSSDIIYMFDQNPDGSYDVPLYGDYYVYSEIQRQTRKTFQLALCRLQHVAKRSPRSWVTMRISSARGALRLFGTLVLE